MVCEDVWRHERACADSGRGGRGARLSARGAVPRALDRSRKSGKGVARAQDGCGDGGGRVHADACGARGGDASRAATLRHRMGARDSRAFDLVRNAPALGRNGDRDPCRRDDGLRSWRFSALCSAAAAFPFHAVGIFEEAPSVRGGRDVSFRFHPCLLHLRAQRIREFRDVPARSQEFIHRLHGA